MKKILSVLILLLSATAYAQLPQKVVICGVCKNVAQRLPYTITIMEKIGALFSDYRVVVYENNSSDATSAMLKQWSKRNTKVHVTSENISQADLERLIINRKNNDFFIPEGIARARNIVLDHAMSDVYKDYPYIIWMDMDFKLEPAYEGFTEVFTTSKEWDAVFAWGMDPRGTFWDWYALRDYICPLGAEILGNDWWYLPKEIAMPAKGEWYPVLSAFGGCGIYKKEALQGCRYSALVTQDLAALASRIVHSDTQHPIVKKYWADIKKITRKITLNYASSSLPDHKDQKYGFVIPGFPQDIIWRMNSFTYKYPSVCEHVTLHASMIIRGHDKLFISPRLLFRYSA